MAAEAFVDLASVTARPFVSQGELKPCPDENRWGAARRAKPRRLHKCGHECGNKRGHERGVNCSGKFCCLRNLPRYPLLVSGGGVLLRGGGRRAELRVLWRCVGSVRGARRALLDGHSGALQGRSARRPAGSPMSDPRDARSQRKRARPIQCGWLPAPGTKEPANPDAESKADRAAHKEARARGR